MRVNTLVIGAGRSGTTSLCYYLEKHPSICFSMIKELHYFSIEELHKRGEKYYHSFFTGFSGQPIVATADTYLLIDHLAPLRIKEYNKDMKIIVILRNPVDRAYSSYNYSVNYGHHAAYSGFLESINKEDGIENIENIVTRNNLGHFYGSKYYYHLNQWSQSFPKENILVLSTQLLKKNPSELYREVCTFLGIEYHDYTAGKELNPNAVPRFKIFENFLLNRDNVIRKLLRSLIPTFLKRWIIQSKVVDKMHSINRKQENYVSLSDDQRKDANRFFEEDLALLANEFGISFEEN